MFSPFCAGQIEQSSEQSEDSSVAISRKDLDDDDEPIVDESTRESRSTRKDVEKSNPIKWSWTSEAVEIFLKYITEFKTKMPV